MSERRVLAVALDATDRELMQRLVDAGELPVLGRLMREGATAALESDGDWMPESAWSTLHTGCTPGTHGVYHWRAPYPGSYVPRRMLVRSWRRPWWELLRGDAAPASGPSRTILLDVPWSAPVREEGMVHVHNWGQRGGVTSASWPPELVGELNARHGRYARNMNREVTGRPLLARGQLRSILAMTAAQDRGRQGADGRAPVGRGRRRVPRGPPRRPRVPPVRAGTSAGSSPRRVAAGSRTLCCAATARPTARSASWSMPPCPATTVAVFSGIGLRTQHQRRARASALLTELVPRAGAGLGRTAPDGAGAARCADRRSTSAGPPGPRAAHVARGCGGSR